MHTVLFRSVPSRLAGIYQLKAAYIDRNEGQYSGLQNDYQRKTERSIP